MNPYEGQRFVHHISYCVAQLPEKGLTPQDVLSIKKMLYPAYLLFLSYSARLFLLN